MTKGIKANTRKSTLKIEVYKNSNNEWYIVDNITGTRVGVVRLGSKGYRIKIHQIKNTFEVYNYLYKRRQFGINQHTAQAC